MTPPMWQDQQDRWTDSRVYELLRDERVWDMGMRVSGVPIIAITTDGKSEVIPDGGPLPTPTTDFVTMVGHEWVRRGGAITETVDAYTLAKAALAVRCWPLDELLKLRSEMRGDGTTGSSTADTTEGGDAVAPESR